MYLLLPYKENKILRKTGMIWIKYNFNYVLDMVQRVFGMELLSVYSPPETGSEQNVSFGEFGGKQA